MKKHKGMVFTGCSFTFGLSLWYYTSLECLGVHKRVLDQYPDTFAPNLIPHAYIECVKNVRYSRLVANHFDSFDIVRHNPSGSNDSAIELLENLFFSATGHKEGWEIANCNNKVDVTDISRVIFQFTEIGRSKLYIDNIAYEPCEWMNIKNAKKIYKKHKLSLEDYDDYLIKQTISRAKSVLRKLEKVGVKTYVWSWQDNLALQLDKDDFFSRRLIPFIVHNKKYLSYNAILAENTLTCEILHDYKNFIDPPKDRHPTIEGHKLIADNIIKFIEKNENL